MQTDGKNLVYYYFTVLYNHRKLVARLIERKLRDQIIHTKVEKVILS